MRPQGADGGDRPVRDPYFSHWADVAAMRTLNAQQTRRAEKTAEGVSRLTVAAGITPSGVVHVGNFREVITVDLVARALRDQGVDVRFIYSWDDFDVFRKVPADIPEPEMLEANLRRSVADVPDPFAEHDSYASHFIAQLEESLAPLGIAPEFIRQSRRYRAGKYAQGIRQALQARAVIRAILDQHRKQPLSEQWLPLAGFCDECGRDEIDFDWPGDWRVEYSCRRCQHSASLDLREGGNVKLPWRIDWPMRWAEESVVFEPGGKDHSSAGGSYDTAKEIVDQVYGGVAPEYVAYDFVRVKGRGGKISSSAGDVVTVADCLEIYEPELLRWIFASSRPNSEFQISFDLDVIKLYEDFDRARRLAHEAEDGAKADKKRRVARRTMELASVDHLRIEPGSPAPNVPPFRGLSVVIQAFDGDVERAIAHYRRAGDVQSEEDEKLFRARARCCWSWIEQYAPSDFRYRIRQEPVVRELTPDQRTVLGRLLGAIADRTDLTEAELIPHMKSMCDGTQLTPKTFCPLAYDLLIDRDQGPKLTTLLTSMGSARALPLLSPSYQAGG